MVHSYGDPAASVAAHAAVKSVEHGTFASEPTLRLMKERDIFLVPTILAFRDATEPLGELRTSHFRHHLAPMIQPGVIELWKNAYRIGVKMVLSTDSSYSSESVNRIGAGVSEYVRLGMTPYEALRAATMLPAELLGIEHRTGQITEGYEADIIAVYSNPMIYPDAFQDIVFVVSNGKIARNHFPFRIR